MTSRDFCFWLQGFFEISDDRFLDEDQCRRVKQHLALVFKHEIDPSIGPAPHQADLSDLHGAVTEAGGPTLIWC